MLVYATMPREYLGKIAGVPFDDRRPDAYTVDTVLQELDAGDMHPVAALEWAAKRLVEYRVSESRAVTVMVFSQHQEKIGSQPPSQKVVTDVINQRHFNRIMQSKWEYQTSLFHGSLGLGLSLHATYKADCEKFGYIPQAISRDEFMFCGECCEKVDDDLHNAIACYELAQVIQFDEQTQMKIAELEELLSERE